jgi:hypothetical protein
LCHRVFSTTYDWHSDCISKLQNKQGGWFQERIDDAENSDTAKEDVVAFALGGRITAEEVAEPQRLFEGQDHRIVLDLKQVKLADRATVRFPARCEANGNHLENCPPNILEWIVGE